MKKPHHEEEPTPLPSSQKGRRKGVKTPSLVSVLAKDPTNEGKSISPYETISQNEVPRSELAVVPLEDDEEVATVVEVADEVPQD